METATVAFDRSEARALFREYRKHLHWSAPIDHEIRRTYQLIAQGRVIIRALESVKAAGLLTEGDGVGFPKLALTRADAASVTCTMGWRGSCTMTPDDARGAHPLARRRAARLAHCHELARRELPGQSQRALLARRRSCPDAAAPSAAPARLTKLSCSV